MKKNNDNKNCLNRREILVSAANGVTVLSFPSLFSKLVMPTVAEAVKPDLPYLEMGCSGGAGVYDWFQAVGENGEPMSDNGLARHMLAPDALSRMGAAAPINGLVSPQDSAFVAGLVSTASAAALAVTRIVSVFAQTTNDNQTDDQSPSGILPTLARLGLAGQISQTAGTSASNTGSNYIPFETNNSAEYFTISNANSFFGKADLSQYLTNKASGNTALRRAVVDGLIGLSRRDLARLTASPRQAAYAVSSGAAYTKLPEKLSTTTSDSLNPQNNAAFTGAFPTANFNVAQANSALPTGLFNVMMGNIAAFGFNEGGFDYHNNTVASVRTKDNNKGAQLGRIIQAAFALQKPLFIRIMTDGGLGPSGQQPRPSAAGELALASGGLDPTKEWWGGDRDRTSGSFCLLVDPLGQFPAFRRRHAGGVNPATGDAINTTATGNAQKASGFVLALYLSLNNMESSIEPALLRSRPDAPLTPDDVKKIREELAKVR